MYVKLVDESPALISNYWEMKEIYLGVAGEKGRDGSSSQTLVSYFSHPNKSKPNLFFK